MEFRGYAPEMANWAVITWEFLLDLLKHSDAFRINFQPGIYIDFVEVLAGIFRMGNPKPEFDGLILSNETPEHDLYLETYLISKTPITIKQFSYFVQETGYITTAEEAGKGWICVGDRFQQEQSDVCWKMPNGVAINTNHRAEHPVTVISWTDAVAFCDWSSNKSGLLVSLPSEAEWEKAARGMDGRIYPWGSQQPDGQLSNFGFSVGDTTTVGSYHPYGDSPYSCYDMAGNVWEWTRSQPGKYPYQPNDGREEMTDKSARRQIRGGSFGYDYRYLRTCARHSCGPAYCRNDLGFRVVTYYNKK